MPREGKTGGTWSGEEHVRASPDGKRWEPFEAQGRQAPALHMLDGEWVTRNEWKDAGLSRWRYEGKDEAPVHG